MNNKISILEHIKTNPSSDKQKNSIKRLFNCYAWILLQKQAENEKITKYLQKLESEINNKNSESANSSDYIKKLESEINNKNSENEKAISDKNNLIKSLEEKIFLIENDSQFYPKHVKYYQSRL